MSPRLAAVNPPELRAGLPPLQVGTFTSDGDHRLRHGFRFTPLLVVPSEGTLTVSTDSGVWVVPPRWGVWIPALTAHRVVSSGPSTIQVVYVHRTRPGWPTECSVVDMPVLLRELIDHLAERDTPYHRPGPVADAMSLTLHLFADLQPIPMYLPMPSHPLLRQLTEVLLADLADQTELRHWARTLGASPRHLSRLFISETGLSFRQWRTRARVLEAVRLLEDGHAAGAVAHRLGYADASTFTKAFRRALNASPTQFSPRRRNAAAH